jgi:HD-GYP domain-containing protein (c-di-GMP phosphodiesterase class II)
VGRANRQVNAAATAVPTRRSRIAKQSQTPLFTDGEQAAEFLGLQATAVLAKLSDHHEYTGRHSLRVANLARMCAQRMNLSPQQVDDTVRVALLHDVGKTAVPVSILDGTGRPSEEEWKTLQNHSDAGDRLVGSIDGHEHIAKAVRAIHERIDGTGYPDGLRASDIPIEARIVAVCDAYEAMTCDERHYKKAFTDIEADVNLAGMAGPQFDISVVRAFLSATDDAQRDGELDAILLKGEGAPSHEEQLVR